MLRRGIKLWVKVVSSSSVFDLYLNISGNVEVIKKARRGRRKRTEILAKFIGNNCLDFWDRIHLAREREELLQEGFH